ncbi:DUF2599 domain-containing protein [Mycobacterium sp.]|uniref:DUF2599 domain-containing protein n=1 Tax=Mycobacterium sp. TaxID=1785 RepID=UPI002C3BCDCF|nr:DUF2599 domain-containing protein [Mycobacterium sp.]HTH89100.1 DUF2599 domain-containing protein [Mycobacterium sp.]
MRLVFAAVGAAAATMSFALAPVASADPVPGPPYVDHVQWSKWGDLSSLRVYPTHAARVAAVEPGTDSQADEAWTEVLTFSPDADMPGMKAQFLCHWHFAELAEPGKVSWNLEPWRNEVSDEQMVAAGCNPGGTEEPF